MTHFIRFGGDWGEEVEPQS